MFTDNHNHGDAPSADKPNVGPDSRPIPLGHFIIPRELYDEAVKVVATVYDRSVGAGKNPTEQDSDDLNGILYVASHDYGVDAGVMIGVMDMVWKDLRSGAWDECHTKQVQPEKNGTKTEKGASWIWAWVYPIICAACVAIVLLDVFVWRRG